MTASHHRTQGKCNCNDNSGWHVDLTDHVSTDGVDNWQQKYVDLKLFVLMHSILDCFNVDSCLILFWKRTTTRRRYSLSRPVWRPFISICFQFRSDSSMKSSNEMIRVFPRPCTAVDRAIREMINWIVLMYDETQGCHHVTLLDRILVTRYNI